MILVADHAAAPLVCFFLAGAFLLWPLGFLLVFHEDLLLFDLPSGYAPLG